MQEEFRQEKAYHKATGILCRSYCTCFYYVLSENLQTAVGRKRHSLQYAFYCSDRKLVWGRNWYYGWVCLRNPAVYPGALYTFIFQVCCDYILAFAALGLAGLFAKQSHGLLKGYIIAVIARGAFHSLGGYLYWMSYMPDNFPKSLTAVYPILYNYSYLLAEGIITVIIISVPAVSKALIQVKRAALQ